MFTVPAALGNKIIHPYGDFLMHDIGTGDGIVQAGPQDTADKLRTAPLWGLRMRPRYMHDLRSLTLTDAIERHRGEAEIVSLEFRFLSATEQQQLLAQRVVQGRRRGGPLGPVRRVITAAGAGT